MDSDWMFIVAQRMMWIRLCKERPTLKFPPVSRLPWSYWWNWEARKTTNATLKMHSAIAMMERTLVDWWIRREFNGKSNANCFRTWVFVYIFLSTTDFVVSKRHRTRRQRLRPHAPLDPIDEAGNVRVHAVWASKSTELPERRDSDDFVHAIRLVQHNLRKSKGEWTRWEKTFPLCDMRKWIFCFFFCKNISKVSVLDERV